MVSVITIRINKSNLIDNFRGKIKENNPSRELLCINKHRNIDYNYYLSEKQN